MTAVSVAIVHRLVCTFHLALVLLCAVRWAVCGAVVGLVIQQLHQKVDVLHSKPQDLILAQLLVWWVCGDELSELRESTIHILLTPALTAVRENTPGQLLRRTISEIQFKVG